MRARPLRTDCWLTFENTYPARSYRGLLDYREALPRLPTGKLYKRLLRDEYWGDGPSKIV